MTPKVDDSVRAAENKHWREVAEFDKCVLPVLVRLRSVSWDDVLSVHESLWQRQRLHRIYLEGRNGYVRKERQIQRYPLQYNYPVRLYTESSPTRNEGLWFHVADLRRPDYYLSKSEKDAYAKSYDIHAQAYKKIDTESSTSINKRDSLAKRLRSAALSCGRHSRTAYWPNKDEFSLDYELGKALSANPNQIFSGVTGYELGKLAAAFSRFWYSLKEFETAEELEREEPTKEKPMAAVAQIKTSEGSQLVRDTTIHFPGVLRPFVGMNEQETAVRWAMHLADIWPEPKQLSAPSDYDAAYYAQNGSARTEFLAALRRVHDTVLIAMNAPNALQSVFTGWALIPDNSSVRLEGEATMTLAKRGNARLLQWLNWREQTPVKQLLTALCTIELSNTNLALVFERDKRKPHFEILGCNPKSENKKFAQLLSEFQHQLPGKRTKLKAIAGELSSICSLPTEQPECKISELPVRLPMLNWPERVERYTDYTTSDTFWSDLTSVLSTRKKWACKALSIVHLALGENEKLSTLTDEPNSVPDNQNYPWDKIEALAEQIRLRKNGAFLVAPNRQAAAGAGLIDALFDYELFPGKTRSEVYGAFTQHYGVSIKADRSGPIRLQWHQNARAALGLPDLKPPKKRA